MKFEAAPTVSPAFCEKCRIYYDTLTIRSCPGCIDYFADHLDVKIYSGCGVDNYFECRKCLETDHLFRPAILLSDDDYGFMGFFRAMNKFADKHKNCKDARDRIPESKL